MIVNVDHEAYSLKVCLCSNIVFSTVNTFVPTFIKKYFFLFLQKFHYSGITSLSPSHFVALSIAPSTKESGNSHWGLGLEESWADVQAVRTLFEWQPSQLQLRVRVHDLTSFFSISVLYRQLIVFK